MICEKYEELTVLERIRLIGAVIHCLQSDDELFKRALELVNKGAKKGVLDGVSFLPEDYEDFSIF